MSEQRLFLQSSTGVKILDARRPGIDGVMIEHQYPTDYTKFFPSVAELAEDMMKPSPVIEALKATLARLDES